MALRLLSGIIAGVIFIGAMMAGPIYITILLLTMAVIGMAEWFKLNEMRRLRPMQVIGYLGLIFFVLPWNEWGFGDFWRPELEIWLMMLLLLSYTVFTQNRVDYTQIASILLGLLYVGFGFHYMIKTVWLEHDGLFWAIVIFVLIWATDSGAYFVGRLVGRTKLITSISPNKTIEGAIGGVLFAVIFGIVCSLWKPEVLSIEKAIILAIIVAFFAQIGDLIQSAYKRVSGIKDSGRIMPGHGGVLDRTDSWIIVFPIVYMLGILPL